MDDVLYYEELEKGDRWVSPTREVTHECVMAFANLTGDHDPLHTDAEFAKNGPYRKPVAHGLLGLSLLAGLSSNCPRVDTLAFTSMAQWQFKRPIYLGDVVHAEVEIVDLAPHGRRAGQVTWYRQLINQNDLVVQQGSFETLVNSRRASMKQTPKPSDHAEPRKLSVSD